MSLCVSEPHPLLPPAEPLLVVEEDGVEKEGGTMTLIPGNLLFYAWKLNSSVWRRWWWRGFRFNHRAARRSTYNT